MFVNKCKLKKTCRSFMTMIALFSWKIDKIKSEYYWFHKKLVKVKNIQLIIILYSKGGKVFKVFSTVPNTPIKMISTNTPVKILNGNTAVSKIN